MKELKNIEVGDKIYFGIDNFGTVQNVSNENISVLVPWKLGLITIRLSDRAILNVKNREKYKLYSNCAPYQIFTEKERNEYIEMGNKAEAQMQAWDKISKEFEEELSVYNGINMDFTNLKKLITEYEKIGRIEE